MMKGNERHLDAQAGGAAGDHGRHVHHRPEAVVPGARFHREGAGGAVAAGAAGELQGAGGESWGAGRPDYSRRPSVRASPGAAGRSASDRRRPMTQHSRKARQEQMEDAS